MRKKSSNNIVEINGKLYDAHTGLPANTPIRKDPTKGGVIDGFVKQTKSTTRPQPTATRRTPSNAHAVHSKTKKTATLNRSATQRPVAQAPQKHVVKVTKKQMSIPHHRVKRAEQTKKSPSIAKFESKQTNVAPRTTQPAPRQAPPTQTKTASHALVESALNKAPNSTVATNSPEIKKTFAQKGQDFFLRRPKALSMSATAIALLLVAGYVTYLNVPNLALRVAAREAGFEASMPGYKPNGYAFTGPVSYEQGRITLRFESDATDNGFSITQRETNWDSQSLLDNHVVSATDLYQTYQERGLTIYVYNGSEATWVNGGVWYSVEGDSRLNAEQLIRIASSL